MSWHFPPEAFPAMRHISSALPAVAADALRLPDITAFMAYWTRVGAYLEAMGEPPATWREVHPVFRDGYGVEAGAEEIADRRAAQ